MNLNDIFPDGLTGEGIFYALNEYNVPWKTSISSVALDLEYYGNVSGGKTISPLLRRLLVDGVVPESALTRLANSLYSMNALRWSKLWNTYQLEYNPIENYRMTEIMEDDDTVTTYGRTHSKTGTESDDRTRTDGSIDGIFGFNSSSAVDSETSDRTIDDDNTHTYNLTDTDAGIDRQTHSYELTRSGNIGVTTSQQMIESERGLWMWKYFYDVVFPDVDKMLTISVYSDDVIPITSGGVTPTGEISITLNGDYDVTEYASAAVQVPNTYTAADDGMVVYNGELVSQIGREISANGTYDTTLNNALSVSVPNTYTAADEGKVVNNGALIAQISQSITENGTYDTTLISETVVNVPVPYALLRVVNPNNDTVVRKNDIVLTSAIRTGITDTFIIPDTGVWSVICGQFSTTVTISQYLSDVTVNLFEDSVNGVYLSSGSGLVMSWSSRSFTKVSNDVFVTACAKSNNGYFTTALYTLTDHGVVGNVLNGSYVDKASVNLTNPDDPDETVTLYVYGGTLGGYSGNVNFSYSSGITWSNTVNNMSFFAPYGGDMNAYNNSDISHKRLFFGLLKATL